MVIPIKKDINFKHLNLRLNIKANILWAFLLSYFVKKKMKKSMTPMTYLIFFAKVSNLEIKIESSSIKAFDERRWFIFSFNLRFIDMITFKSLLNN
jgi:hypothetical protein